jgi:hypothetical protein
LLAARADFIHHRDIQAKWDPVRVKQMFFRSCEREQIEGSTVA